MNRKYYEIRCCITWMEQSEIKGQKKIKAFVKVQATLETPNNKKYGE